MSKSESGSSYCESNTLYAQTPQEEEFLKIYDRLVSKRNPERIRRDAFYLAGMTDTDIKQRLTPLALPPTHNKPKVVEQLTASIYSLTLSDLWKYSVSVMFVMMALLYCNQWNCIDDMPPGSGVSFDVAVVFSILYGGVRQGWLSIATSIITMRVFFFPIEQWISFSNPTDFQRFCWFVVSLFLPMLIVVKPQKKANQEAPSNLGGVYY